MSQQTGNNFDQAHQISSGAQRSEQNPIAVSPVRSTINITTQRNRAATYDR